MKLTNKNKKVTLIKKDSDILLNDEKINPKYILLVKATLTTEYAYLIIVAEKVYHLKSESWLKKQTDKENDKQLVEELNMSFAMFNPITLTESFQGVLPKKLESKLIYCYDHQLFSPEIQFYYNLNNIEVVFLERLTSYTRTFDLSIVEKNLKRITIACIDRKNMKTIKSTFMNHEVVETGPDPVDWQSAYEAFQNGTPWDKIYQVETEEDVSEEWIPGDTDEEYSEEEEELEYTPMPESKRRKLDQKWEKKSIMDSNEDYDNWEKTN